MPKNNRRRDTAAEAKFKEVRNMSTAFGNAAAKLLGERDFMDPALLQAALSHRYERRRRLRRAMDRPGESSC